MLNHLIARAATLFLNQVDKVGHPYILHCLRVMLKQPCIDTQVAGLFHDSKEDHNLSSAILREWGVSERSIILIDLLTRGPQETRRQNICRIIEYPDIPLRYAAIRLKIDDIDDNLHIQRLGCVEVKDLSLINHYLEMRALLSSALL